MNRIYVTGHRNPDTDSIAAAISYAALRNALGDRDYVAAHLGHISDETKRLLDRFGFQEPVTISNVRTQVRDLDFDTPPALNSSVTMDRAWHIMRDQNISAVPIINEDGTLYGMLLSLIHIWTDRNVHFQAPDERRRRQLRHGHVRSVRSDRRVDRLGRAERGRHRQRCV